MWPRKTVHLTLGVCLFGVVTPWIAAGVPGYIKGSFYPNIGLVGLACIGLPALFTMAVFGGTAWHYRRKQFESFVVLGTALVAVLFGSLLWGHGGSDPKGLDLIVPILVVTSSPTLDLVDRLYRSLVSGTSRGVKQFRVV